MQFGFPASVELSPKRTVIEDMWWSSESRNKIKITAFTRNFNIRPRWCWHGEYFILIKRTGIVWGSRYVIVIHPPLEAIKPRTTSPTANIVHKINLIQRASYRLESSHRKCHLYPRECSPEDIFFHSFVDSRPVQPFLVFPLILHFIQGALHRCIHSYGRRETS